NNYKSLMSYSHQLVLSSTVNSYSGANDPTFNDWANLKLDFPQSFPYLGNTFGYNAPGAADDEDPEFTIADYVALNGADPDLSPPSVTILSPAGGSPLPPDGTLTVQVQASDDRGVGSVTVSFDKDGDGTTTGMGETVVATQTGPDTYQAVFTGVSGAAGTRAVRVVAADTSGNVTPATRNVTIPLAVQSVTPTSTGVGVRF